jgi:hypothetical protein
MHVWAASTSMSSLPNRPRSSFGGGRGEARAGPMAETPRAPGPCPLHLRLLTLLHSPSLSSIGRLWKAREVPMGRRAKPAKAGVKAKLPVARKSRKNDGPSVRDLEAPGGCGEA